jgi:hypothetical protein
MKSIPLALPAFVKTSSSFIIQLMSLISSWLDNSNLLSTKIKPARRRRRMQGFFIVKHLPEDHERSEQSSLRYETLLLLFFPLVLTSIPIKFLANLMTTSYKKTFLTLLE